MFLLLAAAGTLMFFADGFTRRPLETRHEKDTKISAAENILNNELDNIINRINYIRRQEDENLNFRLKNKAETTMQFIQKMKNEYGAEKGVEMSVSILAAVNRADSVFNLYVLAPDGKAHIFPAEPMYENSSFLGFRTSEGENIFAEIAAKPERFTNKFITYSLRARHGMSPEKKKAYVVCDSQSGIITIAEADNTEAERIAKSKVRDDLSNLYMLYPAYGRINLFESVGTFTGKSFLKTVLNEELESTPENDGQKSSEFAPLIYSGREIILHTREDPVFGKYSEALTVVKKYPEWNWYITKSRFFEYDGIHIEKPDIILTATNNLQNGYLILIVFSVMGLFTLYILIKNSGLVHKALSPAEKELTDLHTVNFRMAEKIKEHKEKEKKLNDSKLELEEKLALKTKEYRKMNEMLIAENMERTQQDQILRAEKEKAEAANIMKREFLTNTSEKLKTMVTEIKQCSETGSAGFDEMTAEETASLFGSIHSKGGELMNFLGLIIDLSKLEAGKTEDKISSVDFKELFTRLCYETVPLFAATESAVNIEFSDENIVIRTRYRHAEIAFLHLLSYAAKSCRKGTRLNLRYFRTKSLRSGTLVDSATIETGYIESLDIMKGHNPFSLPSGSDSSFININIFNEALKRCGGTFYVNETEQGSLFSVVIPELGDVQ